MPAKMGKWCALGQTFLHKNWQRPALVGVKVILSMQVVLAVRKIGMTVVSKHLNPGLFVTLNVSPTQH